MVLPAQGVPLTSERQLTVGRLMSLWWQQAWGLYEVACWAQ